MLAYGAVFSVNVFVLILPLLSQMSIDGIGGFGNSLFLIFMIIGGAMVIPAGMTLFARLFGQADDWHGGGSFLRSAYYGSRFAGLATLGLAGWVLKKGVGAGKGIAKKIRSKKSDNGESGDGGSADGEDRYTESPAPSDGSDGAASGDAASAEENTDTGGSE